MSLAFAPTGPVHVETAAPWRDPLDKREWATRPIPHREAQGDSATFTPTVEVTS